MFVWFNENKGYDSVSFIVIVIILGVALAKSHSHISHNESVQKAIFNVLTK